VLLLVFNGLALLGLASKECRPFDLTVEPGADEDGGNVEDNVLLER